MQIGRRFARQPVPYSITVPARGPIAAPCRNAIEGALAKPFRIRCHIDASQDLGYNIP